jgi:pyruvate-formate lyase
MLNSVAKLNWQQQTGGALTHVKLPYTGAQNPASADLLSALVRTFFAGGGMGLHFTVVDAQALRDALKEPEKHLDLLVRLGGFSAPFVLLSPAVQKNIVDRTEQGLY